MIDLLGTRPERADLSLEFLAETDCGEWGLIDGLAPHEWAERALTRIRRAYEAAGARNQLFLDRFDGGHQFNMDVACDILNKWRNGNL